MCHSEATVSSRMLPSPLKHIQSPLDDISTTFSHTGRLFIISTQHMSSRRQLLFCSSAAAGCQANAFRTFGVVANPCAGSATGLFSVVPSAWGRWTAQPMTSHLPPCCFCAARFCTRLRPSSYHFTLKIMST